MENLIACSTCGSMKGKKELREIRYLGKSRYVCKDAIQCGQNIQKNAPITIQKCVHCQCENPSNLMNSFSQGGQIRYECEDKEVCRQTSWKSYSRKHQPKTESRPDGKLIELVCVARDAIQSYYHPESQKFYSRTLGREDWYETELWRILAIVDKLKTYENTEIAPYMDRIVSRYNQDEEDEEKL